MKQEVLESEGGSLPLTKAAVVFSAHPWNGTPLGLHHLARALCNLGYAVLFVEPPFSPAHLATRRGRGRLASKRPRASGNPGIWVFSPFTFIAHQNLPALRSRFTLDHWSRFAVNDVLNAIAGTRFERPDLVLSGSEIFSRQVFAIETPLRAYRFADDSTLFASISPEMRRRAEADLRRFDVVFATSRRLVEKAREAGARRVVHLPNGVDAERFAFDPVEPADLKRLPRPRAVYVGAVDIWFDWPAVIAAATAMPHVAFVVIGDAQAGRKSLPANIHLMGRRSYADIASYLSHCDVGLIPFALSGREDALRSINPIKLWEYLTMGLPVVANADLDLSGVPEGVYTYRTTETFIEGIAAALAEKGSAPVFDIRAHTWTTLLRHALEGLNSTTA